VKGETVADRAKSLAKLRDDEGYMSEFCPGEKEGGPHILECHSPILNLLDQYPIVGRLEQDMFEAALGTPVRREETRVSGQFECGFYFAV
jgi:predicted ArsR family transcriptional regulator